MAGFDNVVKGQLPIPCRCSLDGSKNGYCASVIGTERYIEGSLALKNVLSKSDCHTLDRYNLRAQNDNCGTDEKLDWEEAV